MSELNVWSTVKYYTKVLSGDKWTDDDYKAWAIIKSAKSEPFKGRYDFVVEGEIGWFDQTNMHLIVQRQLKRQAKTLCDTVLPQVAFSVVPIPNSTMVPGAGDKHRIVTLANWFSRHASGSEGVAPILRWRKPRQKAHKENGFRNPDLYEAQLVIEGSVPANVVIFDDMVTTGAQMIASARVLSKAGANVLCGVALGRAVDEHNKKRCLEWRSHSYDLRRQMSMFGAN